MKSYITFSVLLIVVLLIGCAKRVPNKEIIEEFNYVDEDSLKIVHDVTCAAETAERTRA
jgi:hypothetical protein